MPYPDRTSHFALPNGSHATPARGPQLVGRSRTSERPAYPSEEPQTIGKMELPAALVSRLETDGRNSSLGNLPLVHATTRPPPGTSGLNMDMRLRSSVGW